MYNSITKVVDLASVNLASTFTLSDWQNFINLILAFSEMMVFLEALDYTAFWNQAWCQIYHMPLDWSILLLTFPNWCYIWMDLIIQHFLLTKNRLWHLSWTVEMYWCSILKANFGIFQIVHTAISHLDDHWLMSCLSVSTVDKSHRSCKTIAS